jgi:hypothetical protein
MKKNKVQLRALLVCCAIAITGNFSTPVMAADYPPSVEVCEVGKPLIKSVAVKAKGSTAVIPVAPVCKIPLVIGAPKTVAAAKLTAKVLTAALLQGKPLSLSSSQTLGGIGSTEKAPVATFAATKNSEVQIPIGVPTVVVVTGLKKGLTGTMSYVDAKGKTILLGKVTVSSKGTVTLPALTYGKVNVSSAIKLVIDKKTTTFNVRSTR